MEKRFCHNFLKVRRGTRQSIAQNSLSIKGKSHLRRPLFELPIFSTLVLGITLAVSAVLAVVDTFAAAAAYAVGKVQRQAGALVPELVLHH